MASIFKDSINRIAYFFENKCTKLVTPFKGGKSTCAFLFWSCALYQNYSALPRRSKAYFALFFFAEKHPPAALLLLFRKKPHSRRLFAPTRAHNAFGLLPTFCECAFSADASEAPGICISVTKLKH